ncbi:unnamed protein product, partial [Ectocarpus sp. 8 AP-2014]
VPLAIAVHHSPLTAGLATAAAAAAACPPLLPPDGIVVARAGGGGGIQRPRNNTASATRRRRRRGGGARACVRGRHPSPARPRVSRHRRPGHRNTHRTVPGPLAAASATAGRRRRRRRWRRRSRRPPGGSSSSSSSGGSARLCHLGGRYRSRLGRRELRGRERVLLLLSLAPSSVSVPLVGEPGVVVPGNGSAAFPRPPLDGVRGGGGGGGGVVGARVRELAFTWRGSTGLPWSDMASDGPSGAINDDERAAEAALGPSAAAAAAAGWAPWRRCRRYLRRWQRPRSWRTACRMEKPTA